MFKVDREDDCIWLTDTRCEVGKQPSPPIHFTPDQAKKVGQALTDVSKPGVVSENVEVG